MIMEKIMETSRRILGGSVCGYSGSICWTWRFTRTLLGILVSKTIASGDAESWAQTFFA